MPEKLVRISAEQAGYMELPGAHKDGECRKVEVKGGISKELGCCNFFEWKDGRPKQFRCGTCEYATDADALKEFQAAFRKAFKKAA